MKEYTVTVISQLATGKKLKETKEKFKFDAMHHKTENMSLNFYDENGNPIWGFPLMHTTIDEIKEK